MKMPLLFCGHGNPMNALVDNAWTAGWEKLGATLPKPKSILCISAHWYLPDTRVGAMQSPRTIHDFGGFPQELYEVAYPAPGDPALATRVEELLAPLEVTPDSGDWGLDHGAWSVLCRMYPEANIPVVQLSINDEEPPALHFELGRLLAPLRSEDVLIVGSGNVVHNLHAFAWGHHSIEPYDWAARFDQLVRKQIQAKEYGPLIDYESLGRDALLSAPTPDHYLPLLYVLGAADENDAVSFPVQGFDGGSVSMLSVQLG
jgi:4,5-DOPA dioxygenase extradiol